MSAARRCAASASRPASSTTNSSPPSRATRSVGRIPLGQHPGHLDQHRVADEVAERVVDGLERVDVDHEDRHRGSRLVGAQLLGVPGVAAPVGQPGQLVDVGLVGVHVALHPQLLGLEAGAGGGEQLQPRVPAPACAPVAVGHRRRRRPPTPCATSACVASRSVMAMIGGPMSSSNSSIAVARLGGDLVPVAELGGLQGVGQAEHAVLGPFVRVAGLGERLVERRPSPRPAAARPAGPAGVAPRGPPPRTRPATASSRPVAAGSASRRRSRRSASCSPISRRQQAAVDVADQPVEDQRPLEQRLLALGQQRVRRVRTSPPRAPTAHAGRRPARSRCRRCPGRAGRPRRPRAWRPPGRGRGWPAHGPTRRRTRTGTRPGWRARRRAARRRRRASARSCRRWIVAS